MKKYLLLVLLSVCLFSFSSYGQTYINTEWETNYGLPDSIDWTASTLDNESNLYIVGNTVVSGQNANILTSKYDDDGNLLWSKQYNYNNERDYGAAIAVDGSGNVYVTGASFDPASSSFDYVTIMYDDAGIQQWTNRYDGNGNDLDIPVAIKVDGYGNIFVTGMSAGTNLDMDYATISYDPGGTELWVSRYNYAGGDDRAGGLEVAPTGEIIVMGISLDSTGNNQYAYLQYDENDGSTLLEERKNLPGIALEKPAAIAQDNYGNFYLTGSVSNGIHYDMYTAKLDDSLQVDWEVTYDGDSLNDEPNAIGVDASGNVFVTGYTEDSNGKQFVTIKYDSNGSEDWVRTESSSNGNAEATDLQITLDDKIYVTGSRPVGSAISVYTVCYDQYGEKQWEQYSDDEEVAEDVQADLYGNVFVTGRSFANGNYSYLALKYSSYHHNWQGRVDTIGDTFQVANEVLIRFDTSALLMDSRIANKDIRFGRVDQFIKSSVVSAMDSKLGTGGALSGATLIKVFYRMTPNDSISISRLGDTIAIPPYWTTFILVLPEVQTESAIDEVIASDSLNKIPESIQWAEPDILYMPTSSTVNDPEFCNGEQHSLIETTTFSATPRVHIGIEDAWDLSVGSENIKVGIFDTGIDWKHEDFDITGSGGSTVISDTKIAGGWDYQHNRAIDKNIYKLDNYRFGDSKGHGTPIAGIIGALRNNGIGISGIAGGDVDNSDPTKRSNGVQLFNMKILRDKAGLIRGSTASSAIIEGASYSPQTGFGYGLHIGNHSYAYGSGQTTNWGSNKKYIERAKMLRNAFEFSYINQVVAVTTRRNDPDDNPDWPGSFRNEISICVSSTGISGTRYWKSGYGSELDVLAPGEEDLVLSTKGRILKSSPRDQYVHFDGTSSAAPHVAGVAALMLSYVDEHINDVPNRFAPEDVEQIISKTAQHPGANNSIYSDHWTPQQGHGLISAKHVLEAIEWPKFRVQHFPSSSTVRTRTETQIASNVALKVDYDLGYDVPRTFLVDIWEVEYVFDHSSEILSGEIVKGWWGRNSSSQSYKKAILDPNTSIYHLEDNAHTVDWDTTNLSIGEVTAKTYVYYLHEVSYTRSNGVFHTKTLNKWSPINKTAATARYSLHIEDTSIPLSLDKEQEFNFSTFPNPANQEVTIAFTSSGLDKKNIVLLDLLGREVKYWELQRSEVEKSLSLQDIPSGLYLIRVSQGERESTRRIEIIH